MDVAIPANRPLLDYLTRRNPGAGLFAAPESAADPYLGLGSHPDVVARLWDQLGSSLPADCRGIVCGTPALVHARSGTILAFALGTQYALRLPDGRVAEAERLGLQTVTRWAGGSTTGARSEFGPGWTFGRYRPEEAVWLREAFDLAAGAG